jgi:hypothetical protein
MILVLQEDLYAYAGISLDARYSGQRNPSRREEDRGWLPASEAGRLVPVVLVTWRETLHGPMFTCAILSFFFSTSISLLNGSVFR